MSIRDSTEARVLLKSINAKNLRADIGEWLNIYLDGRNKDSLSNKEMEKVFLTANPLVQDKYGIEI